MNLVEMICKELGVEAFGLWKGNDGYSYVIEEDASLTRITMDNNDKFVCWDEDNIQRVLTGELKPVWKPKVGEQIFVPQVSRLERNRYATFIWFNQEWENWHYDMGLVFRTKEAAIDCANKMLDAVKGEI